MERATQLQRTEHASGSTKAWERGSRYGYVYTAANTNTYRTQWVSGQLSPGQLSRPCVMGLKTARAKVSTLLKPGHWDPSHSLGLRNQTEQDHPSTMLFVAPKCKLESADPSSETRCHVYFFFLKCRHILRSLVSSPIFNHCSPCCS